MEKKILWWEESCIMRRMFFYGKGSSTLKKIWLWEGSCFIFYAEKYVVLSAGFSFMEKEVLWWEESCIIRRMFFYGKGSYWMRRKLYYQKDVLLWKRKLLDEKKVVLWEGCSLMEKEIFWWEKNLIMRRKFFYGKGNSMMRGECDFGEKILPHHRRSSWDGLQDQNMHCKSLRGKKRFKANAWSLHHLSLLKNTRSSRFHRLIGLDHGLYRLIGSSDHRLNGPSIGSSDHRTIWSTDHRSDLRIIWSSHHRIIAPSDHRTRHPSDHNSKNILRNWRYWILNLYFWYSIFRIYIFNLGNLEFIFLDLELKID